jgi:hypothetical protein
MRASLLTLVFIDQFVHSHYFSDHQRFRREFPIPKLNQHSFQSHASPSWLIYSRRGFDKLADWPILTSTFGNGVRALEDWLELATREKREHFWDLIRLEIHEEFEPKHQQHLLAAIGADDS